MFLSFYEAWISQWVFRMFGQRSDVRAWACAGRLILCGIPLRCEPWRGTIADPNAVRPSCPRQTCRTGSRRMVDLLLREYAVSGPRRRMGAPGRRRIRRAGRWMRAVHRRTPGPRAAGEGLRDAALPRGRMQKGLSARGRLQRKLRTKRGRVIYARRGASVKPVFGHMEDRQCAGQFSMRGLAACQGELHLHAALDNP